MKRILLAFSIVILMCVSGWLGYAYWQRGALPWNNPELIDVTIDDVNVDHRGVRISGIAIYKPTIYQMEGDKKRYIFPITNTLTDKIIKVMVRRIAKPDKYTDREKITVEGIVYPPNKYINVSIRNKWETQGYIFDENLVIVEQLDN